MDVNTCVLSLFWPEFVSHEVGIKTTAIWLFLIQNEESKAENLFCRNQVLVFYRKNIETCKDILQEGN